MNSSRPKDLFGLFADIKVLDGIGPQTAKALAKIDVFVMMDGDTPQSVFGSSVCVVCTALFSVLLSFVHPYY